MPNNTSKFCRELKVHEGHLNFLRECFEKPPKQGKVGSRPAGYLAEVNGIRETELRFPDSVDPQSQLDRTLVGKLATNSRCDPLVAYAAAMAWGGRNMRNFRFSLEDQSGSNLISLLKRLRSSKSNRRKDFERTQKACDSIKGLGISFYTKLLYFFRPASDAYILDQWTAKSAILLFPDCPIKLTYSGMPSPDTKPEDYAWFCRALECLGERIHDGETWSGEEVEQAIFDRPKGKWREYVRAQFPDGRKPKKAKVREAAKKRDTGETPVPDTLKNQLGASIVLEHQKAEAADRAFPGTVATLQNSTKTVRVNCGSRNGLNWQYDIQLKCVHAKVFIPEAHVRRVARIARDLTDEGLDVRFKPEKKTGSIRITVQRGASSPKPQWPDIAKEAVDAMNQLFETVGDRI